MFPSSARVVYCSVVFKPIPKGNLVKSQGRTPRSRSPRHSLFHGRLFGLEPWGKTGSRTAAHRPYGPQTVSTTAAGCSSSCQRRSNRRIDFPRSDSSETGGIGNIEFGTGVIGKASSGSSIGTGRCQGGTRQAFRFGGGTDRGTSRTATTKGIALFLGILVLIFWGRCSVSLGRLLPASDSSRLVIGVGIEVFSTLLTTGSFHGARGFATAVVMLTPARVGRGHRDITTIATRVMQKKGRGGRHGCLGRLGRGGQDEFIIVLSRQDMKIGMRKFASRPQHGTERRGGCFGGGTGLFINGGCTATSSTSSSFAEAWRCVIAVLLIGVFFVSSEHANGGTTATMQGHFVLQKLSAAVIFHHVKSANATTRTSGRCSTARLGGSLLM